MKRLDSNEIMNYLDGTLDEAHRARIDAHLLESAEDRELVDTMRVAMGALHDLDAVEPVRAGDDFWMKVRDNLPNKAPRRSWTTQLGNLLWPQTSRVAVSFRVAAVVVILALASLWFGPQQNTSIKAGNDLSPDAKAFIQMSTQRHKAFVSSQPLAGAPVGDMASAETGDEDDDSGGSTP
jgi:anti-sigma factor RsiW